MKILVEPRNVVSAQPIGKKLKVDCASLTIRYDRRPGEETLLGVGRIPLRWLARPLVTESLGQMNQATFTIHPANLGRGCWFVKAAPSSGHS